MNQNRNGLMMKSPTTFIETTTPRRLQYVPILGLTVQTRCQYTSTHPFRCAKMRSVYNARNHLYLTGRGRLTDDGLRLKFGSQAMLSVVPVDSVANI